jgi:S1-C subfamily serine protease
VVGITVERITTSNIFGRKTESQFGVGSGVIVSPDGYILTNYHVAGGRNNRIIVSLSDGRNVDGETVWSDSVLDLAVVKVNQNGLPTAALGDASTLSVGEPAIAIGNPLGLDFQRTVTSGIISAINRTISIETENGINYMEDLIQTDASINPGNSGGPLLNSRGEVIGINTVKVTSAEAMGFAIPINVAKPVVEKLVNTGTFTEAYMGLFAYDKALLPFVDAGIEDIEEGIYVAHIDEEGPAYKAGLRLGCIIREIDGNKINTMLKLRTIIFSKNPGDTIMVTHLTHGEDKWVTTPVTLVEKIKDGNITR